MHSTNNLRRIVLALSAMCVAFGGSWLLASRDPPAATAVHPRMPALADKKLDVVPVVPPAGELPELAVPRPTPKPADTGRRGDPDRHVGRNPDPQALPDGPPGAETPPSDEAPAPERSAPSPRATRPEATGDGEAPEPDLPSKPASPTEPPPKDTPTPSATADPSPPAPQSDDTDESYDTTEGDD